MILEQVGSKYVLKDCKVLFPNFKGRPTRYNLEGSRNFNVRIDDPDIVQVLTSEGFNVRMLNKLNDSDPDTWALTVNLKYKKDSEGNVTGPEIKEVLEGRSADLNDKNVHCLDDMTIEKAIVEFRGFEYEKDKMSAWLNRGKFWVHDDWFSSEEDDKPF